MEMLRKAYLPVLVLLLLTGLIVKENSLFNLSAGRSVIRDPQTTEVKLLAEPRQQKSRDRIWKEIDFKLIRRVLLEGERVFRPLTIKSDQKGNIYILDFSAPDIVKFSNSGELQIRFGMGKGKGPGELINPTDFCIDRRGNVLVVDPVNFMITEFSAEGKVLSTFRPKRMPERIETLPNGDVAVVSGYGSNLIAIYRNGKLARDFGHLSEQQERYFIAFGGDLAADSEGNLYYAFKRAGLLLSYNQNGTVRFFVKTIDATPMPKLLVFNIGGGIATRFADPSIFTAASASVDNGRVYILNYQGAKGLRGMPLDIYNSSDGSYICTVMTPGNFSSCAVKQNMMYAINDTALFIFQSRMLPYVK